MIHPSQRVPRDEALPVLARFFADQSDGKVPATRGRYRRVHEHLLHFLAEADMSRCLDLTENAQLALSRRRGTGFFGAFGLEEVLVCLVRFVDDDWLLESVADARAQVALVGRLIGTLQRSGTLDDDRLGCSVHESEAAIRSAADRLRPPREKSSRDQASGTPTLRLIRGGLADL